MRRAERRLRLALLLALLPAPPLLAQPAEFSGLDAGQRALLAPFAQLWPRLGAEQRQTLVDNAGRWQRLDPLEQARLHERLKQWLALPAGVRQQLRARHAILTALEEQEQQALLQRHADVAALPEEQRQALRREFGLLSSEQRRAFLDDPAQRELVELAARVFTFVQPDQLADTLALLARLDSSERQRLDRTVGRLPPWRRDQLRDELLQQPPEQRLDHLRQLLD